MKGSSSGRPGPAPGGFERRGGPSTANRVLRGGSWNNNPRNLRVSNRNNNTPDNRNDNNGFRCARTGRAGAVRPGPAGTAGITVPPGERSPVPPSARPPLRP